MHVPSTLAIALLLLAAPPAPTPTKLAIAPLRGGDGTSEGMVDLVTESVVSEIRRSKTFQVLTHDELEAILSQQELNQLVGCDDMSCYAAIGNAAGAGAFATGTLGRVGTSWIVNLKIIDVSAARVVAAADRRLKGGTVDDVLDQVPHMVAELVEGATEGLAASASPATVAAVSSAPTGARPLPQATAEVPFTDAAVIGRLVWITDGGGHYIAYDGEGRHRGPLFAGSATAIYQQRSQSASAQGTERWDTVFWEPRFRDGWQHDVMFQDGGYFVQCGDNKLPYHAVSDAETAKLRKSAKVYGPRWQRTARHVARDDRGNYYMADRALEPGNSRDYRLFVGRRGAVEYVPVQDAIDDPDSLILITENGRFIVRSDGKEQKAYWAVGDGESPLTLLDLYMQAPLIYTELGAYAGQTLGTACDPHL